MGFFKKLFAKKSIEESSWDEVQESKDTIDMTNPFLREQYVISCLEQMKEASAEIDRINEEYTEVTSYLTDMEEIEDIPSDEKRELEELARYIHDLKMHHDKLAQKKSLMPDHEYNQIERICDDIPDAVKKMESEEQYKVKVKNDLARISKERDAYAYRKYEISSSIENSRGATVIFMGTAAALIVILFALQIFMKWDVVIGYYITVALLAISVTVTYVKYADAVNEKKRIESTSNELILLENKVKIRYVNNKNLLDYLYTKYETTSAAQLRARYEAFLKERELRKQFEKNEAQYEEAVDKLLRKLKKQRIKDPELWLHQYEAIYDNREMVEVRHHLIGRRQKLRKQLEYNEQIALEASDEVKDVMRRFPEAAPSLMELVEKYGQ